MSQRMGVGQEKEVGVCGVESDVVMGTIFLFPCSIWNSPVGTGMSPYPEVYELLGDGISYAES